MGLQLATGAVTVVLAEDAVRRRLMAMLDDHGAVRVTADADEPVPQRLARLREARGASLVLVDRLTDGLDAATRRVVLGRVRGLTGGHTPPAVLVDDADGVAALAVADQVLRVDPRRGLVVEAPDGPTGLFEADYRAS